ncbi:MAG TPA: hypothetical protein VGR37_01700 [Longimicrobiaceae bacterium]|nr:hypothetical protein [Longimicrobiaceae bacterium]
MHTHRHSNGASAALLPGWRPLLRRLAPLVAAFALAAFPGLASAQARSAPATGYVYYGDAALGQPWSTKNFDNLSRSDAPAFRGTGFADLSFQVGDTLRARSAVNVRARPWAVQSEEPPIVGRLPAGTRVVIRDIHWIGLAPGLQRSAFWIEYDRVGQPRRP